MTADTTATTEFAAWLARRLPGSGPVRIEPLRQSAGRSHRIHLVSRPPERWVLRVAPPGRHAEGAYDLGREARILDALAGTGIPHAEPIVRADPSAPVTTDFLVQRFVAGITLDRAVPSAYADSAGARTLADAIVDTLVAIARIDPNRLRMSGLGRPEGFLDRQFAKARRMRAADRTRDTPVLDALLDALTRHRPAHSPIGLMHGDYSTLNLRAAADRPRITAVFDWETATLGDPLVDIGYLTARWVRPADNPVLAAFTLRGPLPDADHLARRYTERSGRPLDTLPFYQGLAMARLALALEDRVSRAAHDGTDPELFGTLADAAAAHGWRVLNH